MWVGLEGRYIRHRSIAGNDERIADPISGKH